MPAKKAVKPAAKKDAVKPAAKAAPVAKKAVTASDRGVYVKGLNFPDMDHETVKAAFKQCGDVKDVVLRRKKFCILYFKDSAGAAKAKELNGKVMKGSKITVEAAKRKPDQNRSEYCSSVFVGNLPRMLRKQGQASLKKEFSKCGKVEKVRTYQTGFGFVYFSDNAAAKKAATTMDHQSLGKPFPEGRQVTVTYSIRTKAADQAKEKVRKQRIAAKKALKAKTH